MAYEVTATKERPQTFKELVGQEFVVATLTNSITQGRIAHAYLFSGSRGVGKTSAARILAKALNCEHGPTDNPCGTCSSCKEITQVNSLDVIEIDGASNTSVNDIREIKDEVLFAPNSSRYKIYIIDEVHMLSNSAFNALLKTIEEPPPYIVFIFATTEIYKVPATIRSRCQQFNFRLISTEQIKLKLREVIKGMALEAEEQALFWIAKEATGSLRDGYTLLDQVISFSKGAITLELIREKLGVVGIDEINDIGKLLVSGELKDVLEKTSALLDKGISVEQFVIDLAEYFRNLLFIKSGISRESLLSYPVESFSKDILEALSLEQLEKATEMVMELYRNLKFSLNRRFELELLLGRLKRLDELIMPTEVIEALKKLKASISGLVETGESSTASVDGYMEKNIDRGQRKFWEDMINYFRKEKLALASSLQKVESWKLESNELILYFKSKNKFSGEMVWKEKDTVTRKAAEIIDSEVKLTVRYLEDKKKVKGVEDERVEIVKKIFRGEIVKGAKDGS